MALLYFPIEAQYSENHVIMPQVDLMVYDRVLIEAAVNQILYDSVNAHTVLILFHHQSFQSDNTPCYHTKRPNPQTYQNGWYNGNDNQYEEYPELPYH